MTDVYNVLVAGAMLSPGRDPNRYMAVLTVKDAQDAVTELDRLRLLIKHFHAGGTLLELDDEMQALATAYLFWEPGNG